MPLAAESDTMPRRAAAAVLEPVRPARIGPAGSAILEPAPPAQVRTEPKPPTAALVAWLNSEARSHLRPGCRVAVVGASAPALAAELTRRGYDATAAAAPDGADAPRGRFDFVIGDIQSLQRGSKPVEHALAAIANLARAHGGVVLLGDGAGSQADGLAEILASLGFSPASAQPPSASICWRRQA